MPLNYYKMMTQQVADHIKVNKSLPDQVEVEGVIIPKSEYLDMMSRFKNFQEDEGREPNMISYTSGQVKTMSMNRLNCYGGVYSQKKSTTCGPSSLLMALRCYGISETEENLSKAAGTGPNGTSQEGLKKAVEYINKKYKKNLVLKEYWFNDLKFKGIWDKFLSKGLPVIVHYTTKPLNNWTKWKGGHYSVIKGISQDKIELLCPTKGDVIYNQLIFGQAIAGISQKSILVLEKK